MEEDKTRREVEVGLIPQAKELDPYRVGSGEPVDLYFRKGVLAAVS